MIAVARVWNGARDDVIAQAVAREVGRRWLAPFHLELISTLHGPPLGHERNIHEGIILIYVVVVHAS